MKREEQSVGEFSKERLFKDKAWCTVELFENLKRPIDTALIMTFREKGFAKYCIGPDIPDAVKEKLERRYKEFEVFFRMDRHGNLWITLR